MKLITKKVENQPLTITVEYPELDEKTKKVIQKIKCIDIGLVGKIDEKSIRVDLSDIYYIENVERKVFLYTKNEVLRFEGTMFDIEKIIPETELVRISRTCIMNIDYLREIRQVKK